MHCEKRNRGCCFNRAAGLITCLCDCEPCRIDHDLLEDAMVQPVQPIKICTWVVSYPSVRLAPAAVLKERAAVEFRPNRFALSAPVDARINVSLEVANQRCQLGLCNLWTRDANQKETSFSIPLWGWSTLGPGNEIILKMISESGQATVTAQIFGVFVAR